MAAASVNKKLEAPQWSHLPQELIELTCSKLLTVSDLIRFRGVCRSWRSAAKSTRIPPQIPFVTLPSDSAESLSFFSPSTGRAHSVHLPEVSGFAVCGSSAGWLVLINNKLETLVFNPLTRTKIPLPSSRGTFRAALNLKRREIETWDVSGVPHCFRCYAFMATYPENPRECVIVFSVFNGWMNSNFRFVYCRLGDPKWTQVDGCFRFGRFKSLAYHKGKFYCLDGCDVCVWDVSNDPNGNFAKAPELATGCFGNIMLFEDDLLIFTQSLGLGVGGIFRLYDSCSGDLRLERLKGIGSQKVFLNLHHPISMVATDASCMRGNAIYFQEEDNPQEIKAYDVETGSVELLQMLPCPLLENYCYLKRCVWFTLKFF